MKAMILAAGEGTRLRPLTLAVPKPMVPIANVPLLERTLRLVAAQDVREIAVNLHHRADVIRDALGSGDSLGITLRYSTEERLLGTAGGVKRMERFLDDTFLVLYGDNLFHADLAPLIAFHREKRAAATIATFEAADPSACGLVVADETGRITRFQEKPPPDEVFTNRANAGIYVLEPEILRRIPADQPVDFARDIFPNLLDLGIIYACPFTGYLQDTGSPESYRRANWDVLEGATGTAASDSLLVGADAEVARTATFTRRNIVGAQCRIDSDVSLAETICWNGCHIGPGATISGAVLGRNVLIGARAVIGDGALLADGVRVAAGKRVPSGARVGPGETIS